jgi:hypothetical protein
MMRFSFEGLWLLLPGICTPRAGRFSSCKFRQQRHLLPALTLYWEKSPGL